MDGEGGTQASRSVVTAAARALEPRAEAATPTPCAHPLRGPLLRGPAASIFLWLPVAALVCGAGEWRRRPRRALGGFLSPRGRPASFIPRAGAALSSPGRPASGASPACPAPPRPAPPFGPRARSRGGGAASARPPSLGLSRRACPVSAAAARAGLVGQAGFEGPGPGASDSAGSRSRAAPSPIPAPASGEPGAADLGGTRAFVLGTQTLDSFRLV